MATRLGPLLMGMPGRLVVPRPSVAWNPHVGRVACIRRPPLLCSGVRGPAGVPPDHEGRVKMTRDRFATLASAALRLGWKAGGLLSVLVALSATAWAGDIRAVPEVDAGSLVG